MSEEKEKKSLEEIFGVALPEPQPSTDLVPYEEAEGTVEQVQDEIEQDFQESREKLKNIAEIADSALEDLAHIAKDSEQPRSYDALSKLISAAVQANKAVVEIHKNRIEGKEGEGSNGPQTVNNNLYLTTAEFQRRLEQMEDGEENNQD